MVFQKLVVIKLVNTVAGRNHNIWLVAVAQEGKILRDRIRRTAVPETIVRRNRRVEDVQTALLSSEIPPFGRAQVLV